MMPKRRPGNGLLFVPGLILISATALLWAETTGRITGKVLLEQTGAPIHNAQVLLVQLSRVAETAPDGTYTFTDVRPGVYDVVAYLGSLNSLTELIRVRPGETTRADLTLRLAAIKEEVTVTAKGARETAFEAIQSVSSLDSFDLAQKMSSSIGEVLDGQPGVAKRSFGPGSARPIVRGFEGDRVLVMEDGIRVGSLASQSGDHSEPIDAANIERIEVVKGPATLLYGSNAVGGVVNAITGHLEDHQQSHQGLRGQFSAVAGSANAQGGASVRTEYGTGRWLFWGGGGSQRTGDYGTPSGVVENSGTRISNGTTGLGWYRERAFLNFGYRFNEGRYGIPFAAEIASGEIGPQENGPFRFSKRMGTEIASREQLESVDLDFRRHSTRLLGGFRKLDSFVDSIRLSLTYTDWMHRELETLAGGETEIGTTFDNLQWVYRGDFRQARRGPLSGSFGFWGLIRDYDVKGEEALSPPVDQKAFALFTLQELEFERVKVQLGGRLEHTGYRPQGPGTGDSEDGPIPLPDRDFTGFSAGVGARFPLWKDGAFVANFTTSYRAPALEELYNFGRHLGNLAFEIGNEQLGRERSEGIDLTVRHHGEKIHASASFFYYDILDFVFLAPTGATRDGLTEAEHRQADSRFIGNEFRMDVSLHDSLWLNLGLDAVDAQLQETSGSLPRIPPLRGYIGFELRHGGLSFRPRVVMADRRDDVFSTETRTAGYAVVDLAASYTIARQHWLHQVGVNVFNVGDRLYRNHASFIKDLAPEIGRGVRLTYTVKFF